MPARHRLGTAPSTWRPHRGTACGRAYATAVSAGFLLRRNIRHSAAQKIIWRKCLHVTVVYVTISPSHRNTSMTANQGDSHDHPDLNQARRPRRRPDDEHPDHWRSRLHVQQPAAAARDLELAGPHRRVELARSRLTDRRPALP